ncbi:MAG: tetratricopeptide repeat protein [Chlorobi bacterium]|nr:tetratricopeptide repeat protein [Chlorobiota bacterium]
MLKAKKKIKAFETPSTPLSLSLWDRILDFFQENSKTLWGVVGAVAALAVILLIYFNNKAQEEHEATSKLAAVEVLYVQNNFQQAVDGDPSRAIMGLKDLASYYDGTTAGEQASLMLGNAYLYLGKYDEAIAAYEDADVSAPVLKAAVKAGMATAYAAKKMYLEAAQLYEEAVDIYPVEMVAADRCIAAGRNYAKAGKKKKALEMFERVKKEFQYPAYVRDIDVFINELDMDSES